MGIELSNEKVLKEHLHTENFEMKLYKNATQVMSSNINHSLSALIKTIHSGCKLKF